MFDCHMMYSLPPLTYPQFLPQHSLLLPMNYPIQAYLPQLRLQAVAEDCSTADNFLHSIFVSSNTTSSLHPLSPPSSPCLPLLKSTGFPKPNPLGYRGLLVHVLPFHPHDARLLHSPAVLPGSAQACFPLSNVGGVTGLVDWINVFALCLFSFKGHK